MKSHKTYKYFNIEKELTQLKKTETPSPERCRYLLDRLPDLQSVTSFSQQRYGYKTKLVSLYFQNLKIIVPALVLLVVLGGITVTPSVYSFLLHREGNSNANSLTELADDYTLSVNNQLNNDLNTTVKESDENIIISPSI